ncbi:MAG: PilZ domain-containing protein, partial [Geovibrio sp.]|nr:PilZ domain-containing protein [Geovibrio sp.]
EMDSKLEKLVYLAESENKETDLQTVKALYISSEGCGFFTDGTLKMGELIFLEARSFDTGGRLRFSAVGKVAGGRKTKLGILADLEFSDMEEAVKENIIRYVFEKDRELLKEARDK